MMTRTNTWQFAKVGGFTFWGSGLSAICYTSKGYKGYILLSHVHGNVYIIMGIIDKH